MKWLKIFGIVCSALLITALGIDASDTLQNKRGTLLAQLIGSNQNTCEKGMVAVPTALSYTCVDTFEATVGEKCPVLITATPNDTISNLNSSACRAESAGGALPWRYVTREQAGRLCARSGKRLPTAEEWYQFALDTKTQNCNVNEQAIGKTGHNVECVSAYGIFDTVGNAWEWVIDDVIEGEFRGRKLPSSGFVTQVDQAGVATVTNITDPESGYEDAYFWSQSEGAFAMIRGGFYGSKSDAGIFSVHAHTPPDFTGDAIGFRCVR